MTLYYQLFQSEFSVLPGRLIRNMFPLHICRSNDYTIEISVLLQIQFCNILLMFFPLFLKVFTNILKIYELPKIQNEVLKKLFIIIIYQINSLSRLHLPSELIENVQLEVKDSFGTKLKKNPRQDIFFKKLQCQKSPSFLLHQMLSLFSTVNLVYVLGINIFRRDGIIQICIISSKDINFQCFCEIFYGELGQYLMQFDALEKTCNEKKKLQH